MAPLPRLAGALSLFALLLAAGCGDPAPESFPVTLHDRQPVVALAFSHSGDRLYVAGARSLAYGLDGVSRGRALDVTLRQLAVTREHVYALAAPGGPVELLLYGPDGDCLSCTEGTRIAGPIERVVASADGSTVVALASGQGPQQPPQAFLVNPGRTGTEARGPVLYAGAVRELTLAPDGSLLLVVTPGGDVVAVDTATAQERWRYDGEFGSSRPAVGHLYWSAGAAPLAGLSLPLPSDPLEQRVQPLAELSPQSGALTVLDEQQRGMQLSHDAPPLVRTSNGRHLFGREEGNLSSMRAIVGALSRYDLETRTFVPLIERGAFNALALSPDGETLAVSRGTEIDLYTVEELLEADGLHR